MSAKCKDKAELEGHLGKKFKNWKSEWRQESGATIFKDTVELGPGILLILRGESWLFSHSVWPPYKRWLSEPPSLPTQLIHSHFSDENPSHSWAPASGYHLLPSIWLLFTNTLVVPLLSPGTSDSDHHFPLPQFSWSVSMSVPMTPSNQLSSQFSNLFDARDQHHTPDPSWTSSASSYFPIMDS